MTFAYMHPIIFSRVIRKQRIRRAIQDARDICGKTNDMSKKECVIAWDVVEDLCKADRRLTEHEEHEEQREHWEEMLDKEFDL